MKCPNCGKQVPSTAKVCGYCGHRLKLTTESVDSPKPAKQIEPKPEPIKKAAVAGISQSNTRRQRPAWTWVVIALVVIGAGVIAWYFISSPQSQRSTPVSANEPQQSNLPAAVEPETEAETPRIEPTGPSSEDPFNAYLGSLWPASEDDITVAANKPIVLVMGWGTKTREAAQNFLDAINLVVIVDGVSIPNPMAYWKAIQEAGDFDGDGVLDFEVQWQYPVGELSPGTYAVEVDFTYDFQFTDGFDTDGDGNEDVYGGEYWEDSYTRLLIVQ
jgi:hypothetical protein